LRFILSGLCFLLNHMLDSSPEAQQRLNTRILMWLGKLIEVPSSSKKLRQNSGLWR
jgi:hypothetical protein